MDGKTYSTNVIDDFDSEIDPSPPKTEQRVTNNDLYK